MFYNNNNNIIYKTLCDLSNLLPNKRKIIVTNYLLDKSYYVEIGSIFGKYLLYLSHGIHMFLSNLLLYVSGLQLRTRYHFFGSLFDISHLISCFPLINKVLFQQSVLFLKKKFDSHSY